MTVAPLSWTCALCATLVLAASPAYAQDPPPAPAPAPAAVDSSSAAGVLQGRALANRQGMGPRFFGGYASGFFLGFLGAGIAYLVAGSDDTPVPPPEATQLSTATPTYSLAYQQGYAERLKARRRSSALKGGLLGTLTITVLIVATAHGH